LEALGYRVAKAARGEMALKLYGQLEGRIDVLLTEFALPGMSGLELVDRLREQDPDLAVLIVSTHDNHPELSERLRGGPMHFLRKPFSVRELGEAILDAVRCRPLAEMAAETGSRRVEASSSILPGFPGWFRSWLRWVVPAAVGVVVLATAGLTRIGPLRPPALPELGGTSVRRGMAIEGFYPLGVVEELPRQLLWEKVEGAQIYRVSLLRVDDTVLWHDVVSDPSAALPDSLLADLHPHVVYTWKVEALDLELRLLARSETMPFEVVLRQREEGKG